MKILVQKFGGTSVSTNEKRKLVVKKVLNAINAGYKPVVVVSAMGRKGEPYATDSLLELLTDSFKENNLLATDLLMSCGEVISSVVMSNELSKNNINAIPLTGGQAGINTDENYSDASVKNVDTKCLMKLLEEDKVPVVCGFQGINEQGFVTTLGRGGSDVTAALLGVALKAEQVEIYTDVDGIMTADPRIVKGASLIEEISYNEVFQFADQGAKVIHPRAVEIAMKGNVPLAIKNTMSECKGTMIDNIGSLDASNIITGITHMANRVQIRINLDENQGNENYYELLPVLAENLISIDLINVFPKEKIFTIDKKDLNKFDNIMNSINIKYSYIDNCSKIAIIGSRMRGIPGVMAKILKSLVKEKIEILQTADSHTTIWCLVESKYTETAINLLHKEFNLEKN
ncbi:aspartate kinase [Clostridium botulinum]|uniref:Aspartokinase n=2 Tax=Clostridium botulinum TaxID=1491 RepID=A0A0A0IFN6_CLOBO|nr:aspartate kinase [Clostridium botulinum]KEI01402.1 aspartate kinase [Clostridium botulinum C/D str. BKT75002]KEI07736.1 aspartate kinase [Clostridium botulinum C/D str. BKT2873]KGM94203.1 aspartate kinase [Clostridium botulinum D str. CCUG 7971]KGM99096.1 aspartate kinase [Clostridium botulinum C/D str. DC5]KOC45880.1 aspartate kinase [Clostridium botulinum]